jgi:hypothetical protein
MKKYPMHSMVTSKAIRAELRKKFSHAALYRKIAEIRNKTGNSISKDVALDVVAALSDIKVYEILKTEKRDSELAELRDALSKFNFGDKIATRPIMKSVSVVREIEISPYDLPLTKYDIDTELIADCKMQAPYRKAVSEALLTLETRMRTTMAVADTFTGAALIKEAKNKGVFNRAVKSEEEGLYFIFMGAMEWLRNPPGHKKIKYTKEEAMKIVLFTDYLIKLFDALFNKKI